MHTSPAPDETAAGNAPSRYINRELSWLEFNQRVLDEARNEQVPLLERVRFLAITAMNLDEFFMVRAGSLHMLSKQAATKLDPAGLTPDEQLAAISERAHLMTVDQYTCYLNDLEPALAQAGVRRITPADLTDRQFKVIDQVFEDEISAILTPMAVTSPADFPLLINQTVNVCVHLAPGPDDESSPRFAVIPFGRTPYRFITLPSDGGYEYILLEDVIAMFASRFFPGEEVVECVPFRITRNADLSVRDDLVSDLLAEMEEVLDARKESACVRLEISDHTTTSVRVFLQQTLDVQGRDVYAMPGPLDLGAFMRLADVQGFDHLRYEPWPPKPSPDVDPTAGIFDVLTRRDVLLYHPYESFEPVLRLVEEAADDPDVLAIKQILYRTSRNSPVVAALMRAAERGKYVTVIVELKARFDEARNIEWAKNLEQAGVQVIYGVKGLKTHAKLCIAFWHRELQRADGSAVQRRQPDDLGRRTRGRRHRVLQCRHRLLSTTEVPQDRSGPHRPARQSFGNDRDGDRTQAARPTGGNHGQT
jgi:polyphosphate kinase